MNCNHCGAPMHLRLDQRHFYCEYCTSRYFPDENEDGIRILDEHSKIQCPVCKISLVYGFIGNTQLHFCQSCRGMLVNQDSFLEVIDFLRQKISQPPLDPPPVNFSELERQLNCPTCGRQLSTHLYGGPGNLVVDNCNLCRHLWLDHNEFTRIIRAPGRERQLDDDESVEILFDGDE